MSKQTTFGTILIRRATNERPADWELRLRPICQKIRIVSTLTGDPHLMVAGTPSLSVRIYTIHDIQRLEKIASSDSDHEAGNVDGLKHFRDSYEHSIVFFILQSNHQRDQLSRRDSFLMAAQRTKIRILIVADISQALSAIASIVQSLAPKKREKKRKYFAGIAMQNYLPSCLGNGIVEPTQEEVANYSRKAMEAWATRMEMQQGDSNIALDMLGSIGNIVAASKKDLDSIPITTASKETIRYFFGSARNEVVETDNDNDEDSDEFGDIDDSELLNIPDPIPTDNFDQMMEMYNKQRESSSYDGFDLPPVPVTVGYSSHQARDFYTPINPSFARRRLYHGEYHDVVRDNSNPSDVARMSFGTESYPSRKYNGQYQGEFDDYDYSRSARQRTNQFM